MISPEPALPRKTLRNETNLSGAGLTLKRLEVKHVMPIQEFCDVHNQPFLRIVKAKNIS